MSGLLMSKGKKEGRPKATTVQSAAAAATAGPMALDGPTPSLLLRPRLLLLRQQLPLVKGLGLRRHPYP
jgi:hypothetical protein